MLLLGQIFFLILLITSWLPTAASAQFEDDFEIPENVVSFQVRLEPEKPLPGEHARVIMDLQIHKAGTFFP